MSRENKEQSDKVDPINVYTTAVTFDNPIKDVYTGLAPLSSCGWIQTTEGFVLIDALLGRSWAKMVKERIKGETRPKGNTGKPELLERGQLTETAPKYCTLRGVSRRFRNGKMKRGTFALISTCEYE